MELSTTYEKNCPWLLQKIKIANTKNMHDDDSHEYRIYVDLFTTDTTKVICIVSSLSILYTIMSILENRDALSLAPARPFSHANG